MGRKISKTIAFALLMGVVACSKNTISDRDARRDQLRNYAESKRKELQVVAGDYLGSLSQPNGISQAIFLRLEVKDIPTPVEGHVDPVMTPTLSGYLRFNFGPGGDGSEYIGFAIQKAEFDLKREKLDLVVSNADYKEIILSLQRAEPELTGSWTAPSIAASGTASIKRSSSGSQVGDDLRGEYSGVMFRESNELYQYGHLTIRTSVQPPEGLRVSAVLRVIFGDWNSTEYLTYRFEQVQFNPVNGQIVMKDAAADVMFTGYVSQGSMNGQWFSSYTGTLGGAKFKRSNAAPQPPTQGTLFEALRGTYQGKIKNTHSQANLPERGMVSFVTSQDLSAPNGIKISGNLRLYLGDFGSLEYIEMPLSDIQYNFFTRKLAAKTLGEYKLTLKADVDVKTIKGKIYSDALGEIADFEVQKQ